MRASRACASPGGEVLAPPSESCFEMRCSESTQLGWPGLVFAVGKSNFSPRESLQLPFVDDHSASCKAGSVELPCEVGTIYKGNPQGAHP